MQIPPFEAQTYIGSDIAQMRTDGDRPPRSAKLVASVDMGSGPGGVTHRTYLISTDRARKGWTLWIGDRTATPASPCTAMSRTAGRIAG